MNTAPAQTPRSSRRWLRLSAAALLLFMVLSASGISWLLGTESGLRFLLDRAEGFTHGALQVQDAQGRLVGPLRLGRVRYDDGQGTDVDVQNATIDWHVFRLLYKRLHVVALNVEQVNVSLPTSNNASSSESFSLKPPLDILVDGATVGPVKVSQGGKLLFESNRLDVAGRWTRDGIDVDRLLLAAPEGNVRVDGQLGVGRRYRGKGHAIATWKMGDTEYAGTIDAQGDGRNAQLQLALTQPMLAQLQLDMDQRKNTWNAALSVPRFDPKPLIGDSAITQLGANMRGNGDQYSGTLTGELDLNDYRLLLQPLQGQFDKDFTTLTVQQLNIASPQMKGSVGVKGTVQLNAHPLNADVSVDWKGVELPANLVGQVLDSDGKITAQGSVDQYHAQGDVTLGPPGKLAKFALNLDGTPKQIQLHTFNVLQPQGQLAAQGTLTLQPDLAWQFQATANKFDPGQLFVDWPGQLDADFSTQGKLTKNSPDVTLDLRKLEGTLRQRHVHGVGHLHLSPNDVIDGTLELASGNSTVNVLARPGTFNNADVTLSIASLADWLPQTSGQLNGQFNVRGAYPKLAVNGSLQGAAIAYEKQTLQRLQLQVAIADISHPGGKLTVDAAGATIGGLAFHQIDIRAQGTSAQHQLTLNAQGQPLSTSLTLNGSLQGQNWSGSLSTLTLDLQGLPRWHLQQAMRMAWTNGSANIGELCLTAGDPTLCVNGNYDKSGNLDASYKLHAVPLTLVMDAIGNANMPISANGVLSCNGTIHRSAAGTLTGNASITSPQGRIVYNEHPDQPAVTYNNLALTATLAPGNQQATIRAIVDRTGRIDGNITATGVQQALSGQLALHLDNLDVVSLFTDALANVQGKLDGNFRFGGTLNEPAVTGAASIDHFAAEIPDAGLKLTDGRLSVSAADAHQLRIDGTVQSGKGSLTIAGTAGLDAQTPTVITFKGKQFTAVDIPAAKVVISPDVLVRRDAQGINATGSVLMESAEVNLDKLPGNGVNKASSDIVIVDQPQQPADNTTLPINASIKVDLGTHAHLVGMGLDGHLNGVITVNERPGRETTGQGQVSVSGTYKAYGQNLNIQNGLLLFASSPISNPGLNIRAERSLNPTATIDDGQQVGLLISGTAQRPILTIFSNPAMDQSDALSYLVTGKPISQVKGGEGSMVTAAAQALGSATGNLLAKSVGSKLGISDIGVSSSDALNGSSAFTVGKYLSPRLYLSYGIGLFEPGQVITLRYRLSKRWSFEAQNATDFNRASINYRIEK